jgi:hypothetical protein
MRVIVTPVQVRGTERVVLGVAEFEALFVAGWEPVFRYCLSLTRQTDEAEETTAETFRRAYASWVEGRGPGGQPLAWLFLIARRIVIDRRRRHRLIGWLPLGSPSDALNCGSGSSSCVGLCPSGSAKSLCCGTTSISPTRRSGA